MEANRAVQPRLGCALFHPLFRPRVVLAVDKDRYSLVDTDQVLLEVVWVLLTKNLGSDNRSTRYERDSMVVHE